MFNVGLSTNGKGFSEKLLFDFAEAGIYYTEISLSKEKCEAFDFALAKKYSENSGVKLWSFHLPFMPFTEVDISSPLIAKKSAEYLAEYIKKGADAGIEKFIIHPSGEPIVPFLRRKHMENAKESLFRLTEVAKANGAVLCAEDLPRTCLGRDSDEISELLSVSDDLAVCLDTNHLLTESLPDFIRKVGGRIVTTHISDYDFKDEKHWLPGEGKIDWNGVVSALEDVGYNGVWLYEVGYKAPASMPRSRDLTALDFAENAAKIFQKAGHTNPGDEIV